MSAEKNVQPAQKTPGIQPAASRLSLVLLFVYFVFLWRKYCVHLQLVKIYEIKSPEVTVIVRYSKGEEGRGKNQLSAISSRLYGFIMIT